MWGWDQTPTVRARHGSPAEHLAETESQNRQPLGGSAVKHALLVIVILTAAVLGAGGALVVGRNGPSASTSSAANYPPWAPRAAPETGSASVSAHAAEQIGRVDCEQLLDSSQGVALADDGLDDTDRNYLMREYDATLDGDHNDPVRTAALEGCWAGLGGEPPTTPRTAPERPPLVDCIYGEGLCTEAENEAGSVAECIYGSGDPITEDLIADCEASVGSS